MGLHIYSGSLVRFFTNDWENEIKKLSRLNGWKYTMHYPDGEPNWPSVADVEDFSRWLSDLILRQVDTTPDQLQWKDNQFDYHTFKLHDEAREAMTIVSAHEFRPELVLSRQMPDEPYADQAIDEASARNYSVDALLPFDAELLLPGEFAYVSFVEDPLNRRRLCCSTARLRKALERIEAGTFGGKIDIESWLRNGLCYSRNAGRVADDGTFVKEPEPQDSLLRNAMFGFAVYASILEFSDRNGAAIIVG